MNNNPRREALASSPLEPGRRRGFKLPGLSRQALLRILALLAVIALSVYIFSIRQHVEQYQQYGYLGIFIVAFLAYATVLLPAPAVAIVFSMGAVFPPLGVALAASAGAALGELSGYLAGYSSQLLAERIPIYQRLSVWMKQNGPLTIIILSAIPNPFFDLAGMVAGALKMHPLRFLVWCWCGETIKMSIFAFFGSTLSGWLA